MKRAAFVLLATGFATAFIGCQGATDGTTPGSEDASSAAASADYTLVSLKVPNMT